MTRNPIPPVINTESQIKQNEFYLNYATFVWEKIKLQRETTDRYFNYYLLLITTPIVAFAAIFGKEWKGAINEQFIGSICLLLFVIGVVFFCLYVRQRVNNLRLGEELAEITKLIAKSEMMAEMRPKHDGLMVNGISSPSSPLSADFWVSMIQTVINSFWLTNAIMYMHSSLPSSETMPYIWGAFCITLHILVRDLRLHRLENRLPFRISIYLLWPWNISYMRELLEERRNRNITVAPDQNQEA